MLDDETLTQLLGPACPDCGWWRGQHKPSGEFLGTACPRLAPLRLATPAS